MYMIYIQLLKNSFAVLFVHFLFFYDVSETSVGRLAVAEIFPDVFFYVDGHVDVKHS